MLENALELLAREVGQAVFERAVANVLCYRIWHFLYICYRHFPLNVIAYLKPKSQRHADNAKSGKLSDKAQPIGAYFLDKYCQKYQCYGRRYYRGGKFRHHAESDAERYFENICYSLIIIPVECAEHRAHHERHRKDVVVDRARHENERGVERDHQQRNVQRHVLQFKVAKQFVRRYHDAHCVEKRERLQRFARGVVADAEDIFVYVDPKSADDVVQRRVAKLPDLAHVEIRQGAVGDEVLHVRRVAAVAAENVDIVLPRVDGRVENIVKLYQKTDCENEKSVELRLKFIGICARVQHANYRYPADKHPKPLVGRLRKPFRADVIEKSRRQAENARLYFANFAAFVHYINADQHGQKHAEALNVQRVRRHIFSRAEVKRVQQQADQQRADVGVRGDTFYKDVGFRSRNAPALTSTHDTPSQY